MRPPLPLLLCLPLAVGCATTEGVRYVYQDGDFGVVGIPENTDRWPTRYRSQAEELMAAHFPDGHEIVRAEEVVEGSRVLKVEGSSTAEVAPQLPAALISAAKLGHSSSRSRADTLKIKECRIIYRRALRPAPPEGDPFADEAGLTPTQYVDPNAPGRGEGDASGCDAPPAEPAGSTQG